MSGERIILDMFGISIGYLTQIVVANPSSRGAIVGDIAERKR